MKDRVPVSVKYGIRGHPTLGHIADAVDAEYDRLTKPVDEEPYVIFEAGEHGPDGTIRPYPIYSDAYDLMNDCVSEKEWEELK